MSRPLNYRKNRANVRLNARWDMRTGASGVNGGNHYQKLQARDWWRDAPRSMKVKELT